MNRFAALPSTLAERRARYLIDLARLHPALREQATAIAVLPETEQATPTEVRDRRLTDQLIDTLLTTKGRSTGHRAITEWRTLRSGAPFGK